jgi:hypothetical protein
MRLSDRTYDILKMIQRWIPLVSTLYVALASIWGLPLADEISKTLMAIAAFLAGILEIATATYNKGGEIVNDYEAPTDVVNHEMDEGEG